MNVTSKFYGYNYVKCVKLYATVSKRGKSKQ